MTNNITLTAVFPENNPIQASVNVEIPNAIEANVNLYREETDPIYMADKPSIALKSDIPTKVGDLENDSDFATNSHVNALIEAIPTPDVSGQISAHNSSNTAHADIRTSISAETTARESADASLQSNIDLKADIADVDAELALKVDKDGYVATENNYTTAEKTKLSGIATGANNYVLPSDVVHDSDYVHTDNNFTDDLETKLNGIEPGAQVNPDLTPYATKTALASGLATKSDTTHNHALNNLTEKSYNSLTDKPTIPTQYTDAMAQNALTSQLSNKADLVGGLIPANQLPSYVDDVLSYTNLAAFPVTGEDGKIYIAKDTNLTYRWTGSAYGVLDPSLALGETSSTAYRGDRGKTAYDHSQLATGNPHGTTKTDLNLGNVDNTSDANKPVSTAQQTALSGKVDKTTTVNSKALSANVTLSTADIADSTDKRYCTDAQKTVISNTSNTNTGDETATTIKTKLGITTLSGSNTGDETNATIVSKLGTSLSNKVDKNGTQTLTDNNLTNALKTSYDSAVTNSHTHSNKTLLDGIISSGDGSQYLSNDGTYKTVSGGTTETKATIESKLGVNDTNVTALSNLTGINAGDETTATIKTKLGITTLSGSNTGDQDLSGLVSKTTTVNSKALSSNVTLTTADIADSTDKRYCTDAQKTIISNTSNTNTGDETNATIKTKLGTDLSNKYDSTNFTAGTDYLAPNGSGASLTDLTQSQISGLTTSSSPTFAGATIGSSTGILEVNSGVVGIASAGTDYLTPSGSGASLTTLNASNISSGTLAAARGGAGTINGILKANGSGVVSQATSGTDYLPTTGGTGVTTLGTIGTGTWNATAIGYSKGGSGLSTVALGQLNYGSSTSAYSALAGNTTSTKKFLTQTGTGSVSAAPAWGAIANTDLPTSGATAGSYTNSNITVDTYGRATSVSSGTNYSATSTKTASYTLTSSDNGSTIFMNSSSALTLTVPSTLTAGFSCTIVQLGSGQVTFAGSSTTLYNRNSYTKTAGQYAIASIMVISTSMFIVQGDMSQ